MCIKEVRKGGRKKDYVRRRCFALSAKKPEEGVWGGGVFEHLIHSCRARVNWLTHILVNFTVPILYIALTFCQLIRTILFFLHIFKKYRVFYIEN